MIDAFKFTNVEGYTCEFNKDDNRLPFVTLTTEVDTRFSEKPRSQQHGIYPSGTWLGTRKYHVEGSLNGLSSSDYWQRRLEIIKAVMPRPHLGYFESGTMEVTLTGVEPLSAICTLDGWPELPIQALSPSRSDYQINWKSFDPRLYSAWRTVVMGAPPATITGRAYDKTYDKTYPPYTGQPSDVTITNLGNAETFPKARIYGQVDNPTISVVRPFDNFQMSVFVSGVSLGATEYIDLDFVNKTAIKNGTENIYNATLLSTWWALEPGNSTVRYSGSNIQPSSYCQLSWRNAYMI